MSVINRPALPPEPSDAPVFTVIQRFLDLATSDDGPSVDDLAVVVTPASLLRWAEELGDPRLRNTLKRLGVLWRKPHYGPADWAEVLLPILHPDDIDLGYQVTERAAIPVAVAHLQRIDSTWLIHTFEIDD